MPVTRESARELAPRTADALVRRARHARNAAHEVGFYADHFPESRDPNPEGTTASQRWTAITVDADDIGKQLEQVLEAAETLATQVAEAAKMQRAEDGVE